MDDVPPDRCALCERATSRLTRHHLVPRSRVRKARRRRRDPGEGAEQVVPLCVACHRMVHATLSEKELQHEYRSVESLRAHPEIGRFVKWVRKQDPDRRVRVRRSRQRREG